MMRHQHPLGRVTTFARIDIAPRNAIGDSRFKIDIIKEDIGRIAAKLLRDTFHTVGCRFGNRNAAALIGRIGNDLFFIGDETGPMRMRSSGRLYLGVNDDVLTDNSGNFRVVVYY